VTSSVSAGLRPSPATLLRGVRVFLGLSTHSTLPRADLESRAERSLELGIVLGTSGRYADAAVAFQRAVELGHPLASQFLDETPEPIPDGFRFTKHGSMGKERFGQPEELEELVSQLRSQDRPKHSRWFGHWGGRPGE
jgi:hypothetical protein